MKRILIINTTYKEKGGEDTNIIDEVDFLKENYEVDYLEYKNAGRVKFLDSLAFLTSSNRESNKKLRMKIIEHKPDIVYVHNTWYKGNLGIFKVLKKENIKVFIKLHNFRYNCTRTFSISKHLQGNKVCYMCNLKKSNFYFNKYFQESYLKSIFVIIYGRRYFKILKNYNFNLLVMTNFQKEFLINLGFNTDNVHIYKNPTFQNENPEYKVNSDYLVYAGRITEEKGVYELLEAWNRSKRENLILKIIGSGELLESLKGNEKYQNVHFLGELGHKETLEVIKDAKGVMTATKMYEGQPRLLCEASINGVPSLFPKFGGMSEFFPKEYILKFEQFNYEDLSKKIELFTNEVLLEEISIDIINNSNYIFDKKKQHELFEEIIS